MDTNVRTDVFCIHYLGYRVERVGTVARRTAWRVGMVHRIIAFEHGGNLRDCLSLRDIETEVLGAVS